MKIKLWHIIVVLAALIATPFLFKYAAEHRTFSGVGGEVLLVFVAIEICVLIEHGIMLYKKWREGEEE